MAETKDKRRKTTKQLRVLAGLIMTGTGLGLTGNYWRHATSNFTNFDLSKPTGVSMVTSDDPQYLADQTKEVKSHFVDMVASKAHQDDVYTLSASEKSLVKDTLDQYEFLEETRKDNGLYAAAFRKKDSGDIILTYGGTSSKTIGRIINNVDDMFISTAGGKVSQLDDALAFAKHVEEKYKKVDYISGYSIGGYLALNVIGTGICENATCYIFDSPGASKAMLKNCSALCGDSEAVVTERLQKQCVSVAVSRNTYNTLGQQPGEYLTFSNDVCNWSIIPKNHRFPEFLKGVAEGGTLMHGKDDVSSNGPIVCTTALTALAALGLVLALKKEKAVPQPTPAKLEIFVRVPPLTREHAETPARH